MPNWAVWQPSIFGEKLVYDELTINERQKKDRQYANVLDEVRHGCPSDNTLTLLKDRLIQCDVVDHFVELLQCGQTPVCLFPTRKLCDQFNNDMLSRLDSKVVEVQCSDHVDDTTGTERWGKRAANELQRLNADPNLTAGLESVLRIAVGARVMLRRNIDTKRGLVNGAIGVVTHIGVGHIRVKFDHMSEEYKVEKVKSRFLVLKKFFVYRVQFPLILAFAVTIHKCQGLSLDCALMDLSDQVFGPGMAYVALSRVRMLEGVHLIAFDPKAIMVSSTCLQEINRLRQMHRKDLPTYEIPVKKSKIGASGAKRKLSSVAFSEVEPKPKKAMTQPEPKPKKVEAPHINGNMGQNEWPMFRFHPVDALWQKKVCRKLGMQFHCANRFGRGGPDRILTLPSNVRDSLADGNCLFRSLSMIITGSQDEHLALRSAIINHMHSIQHHLIGSHIAHKSVNAYIHSTRMDQSKTWGTDVEILVLAHLLETNIYTFHSGTARWHLYSPSSVDSQLSCNVGHRSMYIKHIHDHFQVVSSVNTPHEP